MKLGKLKNYMYGIVILDEDNKIIKQIDNEIVGPNLMTVKSWLLEDIENNYFGSVERAKIKYIAEVVYEQKEEELVCN